MTQPDSLNDARWEPYCAAFNTLPLYYFNSLRFPENYEQATMQIKSLELDMRNIEAQFEEREEELCTLEEKHSEEGKREHKAWKTKALRAQRMKFNQIRLLEAWALDHPPTYNERFTEIESRLRRIEAVLNLTED